MNTMNTISRLFVETNDIIDTKYFEEVFNATPAWRHRIISNLCLIGKIVIINKN